MRSLPAVKTIFILAGAAALVGCLVSDEPVLDASNGRATPLDTGAYVSCDGEDGSDCNTLTIARDATRLYRVMTEDEEALEWRFRKVGRRGYVMQSREDDGYAYYYGAGDADEFSLTMMMCEDLPADLRARLIDRGDLETDDDDLETCTVKTVKGATAPAKAYHRGQIDSEEDFVIVLRRASDAQ